MCLTSPLPTTTGGSPFFPVICQINPLFVLRISGKPACAHTRPPSFPEQLNTKAPPPHKKKLDIIFFPLTPAPSPARRRYPGPACGGNPLACCKNSKFKYFVFKFITETVCPHLGNALSPVVDGEGGWRIPFSSGVDVGDEAPPSFSFSLAPFPPQGGDAGDGDGDDFGTETDLASSEEFYSI